MTQAPDERPTYKPGDLITSSVTGIVYEVVHYRPAKNRVQIRVRGENSPAIWHDVRAIELWKAP